MTKDLISVIVPVYNVGDYVKKCVNSIINQTYKNIEIILVDDGSTDSSGKICDELAKTDSRIKVIHKENGGLSDARNAGIKIAEGKYFSFVDSDDCIHPKAYEILINNMIKYNADISECGITYESQKNYDEFIKDLSEGDSKIFDTQDALVDLYSRHNYFHIVAWSKLYKRFLFDNIEFPKGMIHEDMAVMYLLFEKCKNIVGTTKPLYYVNEREGSITRSKYNKFRLECWTKYYFNTVEYFERKQERKILNAVKTGYIRDMLPYLKKCQDADDKEMIILLMKKYVEFFSFKLLKNYRFKSAVKSVLYYYKFKKTIKDK